MKFDSSKLYFIHPVEKYGLTISPIRGITSTDFTFLASVTPDWNKMNDEDVDDTFGLMCLNGKHLGIFCKTFGNKYYIGIEGWVKGDSGDEYVSLYEEVFDLNSTIDIGFVYKSKSMIKLYLNNKFKHIKINNELIDDYKSSIFWVGCATAQHNYDEKFRHYYHGEFKYSSVHSKSLKLSEIYRIFSSIDNISSIDHIKYNTIFMTDFKTYTPYKILDNTMNGNHLTLYMPDI